MSNIIGIDLGVNNCRVATYQYGMLRIIENDEEINRSSTPSIIAFNDHNKRLFGSNAQKQLLTRKRSNVLFGMRRLIGKRYDDQCLQNDIVHCPFKVSNEHGKPVVKINYGDRSKRLTFEELISMLLWKMKTIAEQDLNGSIDGAVITVPSCYTSVQRQATLDAAKIIDLNVLVYHIGGSSFSCSLIELNGGLIRVCATSGDANLGGDDFTQQLIKYCCKEYQRKCSIYVENDERLYEKLRVACEDAKCMLSYKERVTIEIDDIEYKIIMKREQLENLCKQWFESTIDHIRHLLNESNVKMDDVDEYILTGGSCRIPLIGEMIQKFFLGKLPYKSIDMDNAAVYGAAIKAAIAGKIQCEKIDELLVIDSNPLPVFVSCQSQSHGKHQTIFKSNVNIPLVEHRLFSTTFDMQKGIMLQMYQGDANNAKIQLIARYTLDGIQKDPNKNDSVNVDTHFMLDTNGIISVNAVCNGQQLLVRSDCPPMSSYKINRLKRDSEIYSQIDDIGRRRTIARNEMHNYLLQVQSMISNKTIRSRIPTNDRTMVDEIISNMFRWLEQNSIQSPESIEEKLLEIKQQTKISIKLNNMENQCAKILNCGHVCHGVPGEIDCLNCLYGCFGDNLNGDEYCSICYTEPLFDGPTIQLQCNHLFHLKCIETILRNRWPGERISFHFSLCPICKTPIEHVQLKELLDPIKELYNQVKQKALIRLEYDNLHRCNEIMDPSSEFYNDPSGYALKRYSYYICYKCNKPYFGGEARCEAQNVDVNVNQADLICGACSNMNNMMECKHGSDYLGYKCRYCCSYAVYFCFGDTHFCNRCHGKYYILRHKTTGHPSCPVGPGSVPLLRGSPCPLGLSSDRHPPTGKEFAIGCAICKNSQTIINFPFHPNHWHTMPNT
ncbi:Hsp70 chaperone [Blomia tropicalis]|nr:Hsp70 chaperone [Blomia tropicalis]